MSAEAWQEGLFTCTIARRPEINTRMCWYITYSESSAQTLQFHAHPSPSCFSACSKSQSRWACMHDHDKAFVRWFRCFSCACTQENIFFHGLANVACTGVTHLASWTCRCSKPSRE
jgi:hypothetical protein